MVTVRRNPFGITKAVDLSDQQINDYWVDIPGDASFRQMIKPASPMPMLILGSKGSGKTHLMRYFSYSLQKLRHKEVLLGLQEEEFVGIYLRCGGLNAKRFSGKGQSQELWRDVFAYYTELWLAQLTLAVIIDAVQNSPELRETEPTLCSQFTGLFEVDPPVQFSTLRSLVDYLRSLQRTLDAEINNCVITRRLNVNILVTPGRLVFGIPEICAALLPSLSRLLFVYLIDEFENLTEDQQRFVNTLVREKEHPTSFKIGARLYGVRTYHTYSADEENKEGSEFEILPLDKYMRENLEYPAFAKLLCLRRLHQSGYLPLNKSEDASADLLSSFFVLPKPSRFHQEETLRVVSKYPPLQRPYFEALVKKLASALQRCPIRGLSSPNDIDQILSTLSLRDFPLLEKTNLLLFYKSWSTGEDLMEASRRIAVAAVEFLAGTGKASDYKSKYKHFAQDLFAQLLRQCGQRQRYLGINTFINMSQGCPRNLLIILKHIHDWSLFNGEAPFVSGQISIDSQQQGVREASEWFSKDARMPGDDGITIRAAVSRLATLFREVRFSDKPSECSLIAFSADLSKVTKGAARIISLAEQWSLLVRIVRGQRDKNSKRIDHKYELNRMLSPYWDLPISRRGTLALTPEMVTSIFDETQANRFESLLRSFTRNMVAPWFGHDDNKAMPLFKD